MSSSANNSSSVAKLAAGLAGIGNGSLNKPKKGSPTVPKRNIQEPEQPVVPENLGPHRAIQRIGYKVYVDSNTEAKNIANNLNASVKNRGGEIAVTRDMVIRQWLDRLAKLPWDKATAVLSESDIGAFIDDHITNSKSSTTKR